MAKKKIKSGGRDFQPGNSYGKGRPKLSPEQREVVKATKTQIEVLLSKFMAMTPEDATAHLTDPKCTLLEAGILNTLLKASEDGDQHRLDWFFNRTIGKVKDVVDLNVMKPTVIVRPSGERVELGAEEVSEEG